MGKLWRVVGIVAVLWCAGAPAVLAEPDSSSAADLVAALNGSRADDGLAALEVRGDLADVAAAHATRMADQGRIFHNNELGSVVAEWEELGENVGVAPTVEELHHALMNSPSHRRNILSSRYNHIGLAVERRGDRIYAVQVFRRLLPAGGGARSAPAAAPVARPAPSTRQVVPAVPSPTPDPVPVATTPAEPLVAAAPVVEPTPVAGPAPLLPRTESMPAPISVRDSASGELVFASVALLALVATWCGRVVLSVNASIDGGRPAFAVVTAAA